MLTKEHSLNVQMGAIIKCLPKPALKTYKWPDLKMLLEEKGPHSYLLVQFVFLQDEKFKQTLCLETLEIKHKLHLEARECK